MLLHDIVTFAAAADPHGLALVADGTRWTFGQLESRIYILCDSVSASTGSSPSSSDAGDRVVIISENTPAMVAALYAVPMAGAIATFANTRHTPIEIADLIEATEPSLILISDAMNDSIGVELRAVLPDLHIDVPIASLEAMTDPDRTPAVRSTGRRTGSEPRSGGGERRAEPDESNCAWLIHTSGTTGRAKGAMLTHRNLITATVNTAIGRPMADDDVYLMPFPLFHVAAYNVLHAHIRRRPVVLMRGFDAGEAIELISRESVTNCSLAPTMLAMLLDHPDRCGTDLSRLRQISYGASAMPRDLLLRVAEELPGCGLAQGYGMTELSGNAVFLTPDDHRWAIGSEPGLLSAAGRPGPLVQLRIGDDSGNQVEPGENGEILVRGDQVCAGYWNAPEETARTIEDGWLHTGDVGFIDPAGYLHVVDRKKDIIISGGENVASREVEDLLSTHPHVGSVAVIGLPDERWGELVSAVVVTTEGWIGEAELIEWTRGRIAGFKRPRRVFTVDTLPLNASGKVDKVALRNRFGSDPVDL